MLFLPKRICGSQTTASRNKKHFQSHPPRYCINLINLHIRGGNPPFQLIIRGKYMSTVKDLTAVSSIMDLKLPKDSETVFIYYKHL